MGQDLRTYLATLERSDRGQLKVVSAAVDPEFEAAAIVERIEGDPRYPGFPALLFKNIRGASMPLLINLYGTYERLALAFGSNLYDMVEDYAQKEGSSIPTTPFTDGTAPAQEVVLTGSEVDLSTLPLLVHNELDAGKYFTSAVLLCRDPDSGRQNAGIFRHQLQGPRQLGVQINPAHHTAYVLRSLREQGESRMEVALVVGHHPAVLMGAVSKLEGIGGEMEVAGGLLGESLETVRAKTVHLDVPARAEVIIEGFIETDPEKVEVEGPFGEYPRYYTGVGPQPYMQITALTMRSDAIFQDIFNAHTEHSVLGGLPRMGSIQRRVQDAVPSVKAVNLPLSGLARSHLYMSMKKRVDGEPKLAATAALAVDPLLKHIFVVDDDIDVFDETAVLRCMVTRFQADRDLTVMPGFLGGRLNPVTYGVHRDEKGPMETKLILDMTRPAPPTDFPPMCHVPADVVARVRPEDLIEDWQAGLLEGTSGSSEA